MRLNLECVVREVHEEISYFVSPERFEHLASYNADIDGASIRGEIFIARDLPTDRVPVTEGSLLVVEPDELKALEPRLSPSARSALLAFFTSS
jgi:8-oxo-dGTP pyrophosphatase MutT (NUDIX family)